MHFTTWLTFMLSLVITTACTHVERTAHSGSHQAAIDERNTVVGWTVGEAVVRYLDERDLRFATLSMGRALNSGDGSVRERWKSNNSVGVLSIVHAHFVRPSMGYSECRAVTQSLTIENSRGIYVDMMEGLTCFDRNIRKWRIIEGHHS